MADPSLEGKPPSDSQRLEEGKKETEEDDDRSDSEDDSEVGKEDAKSAEGCNIMDNLTKLRREKRLAMNRESARARRKRKKIHIETLEQQVSDLTRSNEKFKRENAQLVVRVEALTERLARQEEELMLLRSLVGKSQNAHLSAQQMPTHPSLASNVASPAMRSLAAVPQGLGATDASAFTSDASLRQLLHTQSLSRAAAEVGNRQGLPYGVPPNRAIDQEVLSRIGRDTSFQGLYGQGLPPNAHRHNELAAGLAGHNTVRNIYKILLIYSKFPCRSYTLLFVAAKRAFFPSDGGIPIFITL